MADIYLYIESKQAGPYQPNQVRQLLAEGKVSLETSAWYQGLKEWSTLAKVLAAFPAEETPPLPLPPAPPLPLPAAPALPKATPAKKGMNSCLLTAIILAGVGFVGLFLLSCLAGIALGPINKGIERAREAVAMQRARQIAIVMYEYSMDHNGAYPEGTTSTEVFQKLIDGNYVKDASLFYLSMPGKVRPTSNKLSAENVCFDVTSGVAPDSPNSLPLVFSTGYNLLYTVGGIATPDPGAHSPFPGIAVAYKDNSAHFYNAMPDGTIARVMPVNFDSETATFQQLKP